LRFNFVGNIWVCLPVGRPADLFGGRSLAGRAFLYIFLIRRKGKSKKDVFTLSGAEGQSLTWLFLD
jgi:hypothetical protein